jgi:DNA primase
LIPNYIIEEIRQRVDIVEVISNYIALKKRGNNYIACCPFHKENTPSFTVSTNKQMYHCFGCGVSGDALKFVIEHTGLDFVSAVERLASICGVTIQYSDHSNSYQKNSVNILKDSKSNLNNMMLTLTKYYQQNLIHLESIKNYLKKRAISHESIANFNIGYATNMPLTQVKELSANNEDLITLGMLVLDQDSDRSYNRFNDRLMFPIKNVKGEIIAFGARAVNAQIEPKYLNSANTVLFDKSKELYGLYQSLKTIKETDAVIVVEGYIDVVMMHQCNFSNAVASMGTSITELQIKKLFRYANNIYFMFDGDKAGKKAAWRALEISIPIVQDHKQIHFIFLPDGEDPDSILRVKGHDFVTKIIQKNLFSMGEFLVNHLSAQILDLTKDSGKSRLISVLRPYYNQLQAVATKAFLVTKIAQITGLESYMIEQILLNNNKTTRMFYGKYAKLHKLAQPMISIPKNNLMLRRVLKSLLLNPKIARSINLTLEMKDLTKMQQAILNLLDYLSVDCDSFDDIELSKIEAIFINVEFDIIEMYKQLHSDLLTDQDNTLLNAQRVSALLVQDELEFLIKG